MFNIPWNPIRAILFSTLRSLLPAVQQPRIPVFMMLPLDSATPAPKIPLPALKKYFEKLSSIGASGVMLDVWWGLCEKSPEEYDFSQYVKLLQMAKDSGLRVQAVMSFHACGGNVGDSVNIPLPSWVVTAAEKKKAWFKDKAGNENHEYISLAADGDAILPGLKEERTPVQAYASFVRAFVDAMRDAGLFEVLAELQVGLGPCGELRYPSYPMAEGKWEFPGIGQFQCYDEFFMNSLARAKANGGDVGRGLILPADAGTYKDNPQDTSFFTKDWRTPRGKFLLNWYSGELLRHGRDVLSAVKAVTDVPLAVKVAGIHWWYFHSSRAAECTAGYIGKRGSVYREIAEICAQHEAVLDFTCLEMRTMDQPMWARCGPRQLVKRVFGCAARKGVAVAGENALETWEWKDFQQIVKALRRTRARKAGYTHLRLSDEITEEGWKNFERFVKMMARR